MTILPSPESVQAYFAKTEQPKPTKKPISGKRPKRKSGRRMKRYTKGWKTWWENKLNAKREAQAKA